MHKSALVIGSGLAGISAASHLSKAGIHVTIVDKGRGPGGRMATRRLTLPDGAQTAIDHGAQFIRARDPRFHRYLTEAGVADWPAAGPGSCVGVPGNRSLAEAGLVGLNPVQQTEVTSVSRTTDGWRARLIGPDGARSAGPFDCVLCTAPAAQAARLFPDAAQSLSAVRMAPCWAAMLVFSTPVDGPDLLTDDRDDAVLSWAAREGGKPGRLPEPERWILHAAPGWSRAHLEDPAETVLDHMQQAWLDRLEQSAPPPRLLAKAHRWRYARVEQPLGAPYHPVADGSAVLAGDWCLGPRAEAAFLSGLEAARALTRLAPGCTSKKSI